jgi:hypothetical protein
MSSFPTPRDRRAEIPPRSPRSKLSTLPALSALAQAYRVNGDTGLNETTEQPWVGFTLDAESSPPSPTPRCGRRRQPVDLRREIQQRLAEAVGIAFDQDVFVGTNKPASWPR